MIDIEHLSEEELVALHHRVVERLRFLDELKTHESMLKYRPGDRVSFTDSNGREVTGRLLKYNKKTVTVVTDVGQRWNVSPGFLRAEAIEGSFSTGSTVVSIDRSR